MTKGLEIPQCSNKHQEHWAEDEEEEEEVEGKGEGEEEEEGEGGVEGEEEMDHRGQHWDQTLEVGPLALQKFLHQPIRYHEFLQQVNRYLIRSKQCNQKWHGNKN